MFDRNNNPLKDGDAVEVVCPFCGWTHTQMWGDNLLHRWTKCVHCRKKYRVKQGDVLVSRPM